MLLHLLPRQSLRCPQGLLTRCVQTLRRDPPRALHSQAQHFLRRRLPLRFQTQSRGTKSRNRKFKSQEEEWKTRNKTVLTYIAAAGVGMIGLSYAAVPLYRLYCQVRGELPVPGVFDLRPAGVTTVCVLCLSGVGARRHGGGWPRRRSGGDDEAGEGTCHQDHLQRRPTRQHAVELQTAADGDLCKTWSRSPRPVPDSGPELGRIPLRLEMFQMMFVVQVVPGETALAFYRAKNPTDKPITGISTYNVVPFEAGQYFNKIQVVLRATLLSSPLLCPR